MVIYIGSDNYLPILSFDNKAPSFHTQFLSENDRTVLRHFSTQNVLYAGSSEGCGCGFNHALLEGDQWIQVIDEDVKPDKNINMRKLYDYLINSVDENQELELYACWDGDFEQDSVANENIQLEELLDSHFFLKERCFYTIKNTANSG